MVVNLFLFWIGTYTLRFKSVLKKSLSITKIEYQT